MEITFDFKSDNCIELMEFFAKQVKVIEGYEEELRNIISDISGRYERSVDDRVELEKRVHELESENLTLREKLGGDVK